MKCDVTAGVDCTRQTNSELSGIVWISRLESNLDCIECRLCSGKYIKVIFAQSLYYASFFKLTVVQLFQSLTR